MKKIFIFTVALVLFQAVAMSQVIMVSPNVTNNASEVKAPVSKQAAFRISPFTSPLTLPANTTTELNLGVKEFDLGNNISGSSFVVPENGIYHFDVRMNFTYPITDYEAYLRFYLMLNNNGTSVEKTILMNPQTDKTPFHTLSISTTLMLRKGDMITTSYNADANSSDKNVWASEVSFSGFKVNIMAEGAGSGGVIK